MYLKAVDGRGLFLDYITSFHFEEDFCIQIKENILILESKMLQKLFPFAG